MPLETRYSFSITDEFMLKFRQKFDINICTNSTFFPHLLYVIVLVHSIGWLWHNLANLLNMVNPKGMEIMGCQVTETWSWMQNKDLLPPQYGAGRPPSFVLGCWKGHQETRVSLRREGNARVKAHQLCESEVRHSCHTSGFVLQGSFWISVILFRPVTYTHHRPK